MKAWENRLHNQVDEVLYNWMKETGKAGTTPEDSISILNDNGFYKAENGKAKLFRDDLRKAREKGMPYYTKHLKFEQEKENASWNILLRTEVK